VSLEATLARIELLRGTMAPPPTAPVARGGMGAATAGVATAATATPFAAQLQSAIGAAPAGAGAGARALAAAQAELGVAEAPPGSNDGPRIAEYRAAVPGGPVGPWCAYFVSWAARQAGAPIGEQGQGYAAVSQVWDWAQRSGRAIPPTGRPQPGDLIVWGGRHIGIVEAVAPDGSITTVEGNSSDAVSRRTYGPDGGGATGYVRLG
jgi:hypothetical protein